MFERQFGLRENPFVAGHQARFVYPSREHQEALAHLRYGIENREPFVLITGEVGTGKTTALYDVLGEWQTRVVVALITNSALTRDELLEEISLRFGVPALPGMSKPQILAQLERHLLAVRARGERAILILDEAQNLSRDLLEEIRLLSNLEVQGDKLMQVFLVGQPELEALLARPELRQLRQRIAVHYRLNPLSDADTERYIHHRLTVAGGHAISIFSTEACREVYVLTHGIPREINTVAAQAMLNAFVEDASIVLPEHVRAVARDTEFQSVVRGNEPAGDAAGAAHQMDFGDGPLDPPPAPLVEDAPPRLGAPPPAEYGPPRLVPPPAPRAETGPPPLIPRANPADLSDAPGEHHPDATVRPAASADAWDAWKAALKSMPGSEAGETAEAPAEPVPTPPPARETVSSDTPALQSVARVREELIARSRAAPPRAATPAPEAPEAGARVPAPELPLETVRPRAREVAQAPPRSGNESVASSSLPPSIRRKLEFADEAENTGSGATRWLVIAGVVALVAISAILANRFLVHRRPAQARVTAPAQTTPARTTPAPQPTAPPAVSATPAPQIPASVMQKPAAPEAQKPAPTRANTVTTTVAASKPVMRPTPAKSTPAPRTTAAKPAASVTGTHSTAAPKSAPASGGRAFGIAVATFLYEDRAAQERDRLASSSGLPARIVPVTENGETSYRVVLGAFADRAAAEQAASRLIEQGLADEARVLSFAKK